MVSDLLMAKAAATRVSVGGVAVVVEVLLGGRVREAAEESWVDCICCWW
jgi:hypothetical protein